MTNPTPRPSNLETRPCLYRGRFAPSPSGPLHFGSLIAAVGSYLQAKSQQGEWLVRIDDIDPPREVAGASKTILTTLEQFGFEWDGPITYQSTRHDRYQTALDTLQHSGKIYPCACTRKAIAEIQTTSTQQHIYPATCRKGLKPGQSGRMLRMNTEAVVIEFDDRLQGHCHYPLDTTVGDYVVLRAGGFFSYQLATSIDDAEQGITEVVRGYDLLDSTPCQIYLQQSLELTSPDYCHLPIVLNAQGQKLSKQHHATALEQNNAPALIWQALMLLGQEPPATLAHESLHSVWQWAFSHWQTDKIPKQQTFPLADIAQT